MTIIKHYINNRWTWYIDGSHTAYDVVSQITDQYKYDDKCKYIHRFEQLTIGNNNQSKKEVEFLKNTEKKEKELRLSRAILWEH